jgi:Protein of unknown function (DUF3826)
MRKGLLVVVLMMSGLMFAYAQKTPSAEEQANYTKVITDRAGKIVNVLNISDSVKYKHVRDIIVDQYRTLGTIHDTRNAQVAVINDAKKQPGADKVAEDAKIAAIDTDVTHKLAVLHKEYISKLAKELTPAQIDQVKDEMTYKLVEVTYTAYVDEVLTLTQAQKDKIKAWLVEAREIAIDAESSNKKHDVFGKYKGRINNYLSAQGYDMKKEGEEWQKRLKEKAGKN